MADDRTQRAAAPAPEVHDDDELADILAAELQRYATGTVPTFDLTDVRPRTPAAQAAGQGPTRGSAGTVPTEPTPAPAAATRGQREPDFGRRAAEVERAFGTGSGAFRRPAADEPAPGRRSARPVSRPSLVEEEQPVRRRSGFRPPLPDPAPPSDPIERVMPTGPVSLPESTASLLDDMLGDPPDHRPARHAAPPPLQPPPLHDPLRATGPLDVPRGLYTDWERSLRSIGRPGDLVATDDDVISGAPVDAPTVAVEVQRSGEAEVRLHEAAATPPEPAREGSASRRARRRAVPVEPAAQDAPTAPPAPSEPPTPPERSAPSAALPVHDGRGADSEGLDEVDAPHPQVSAAVTGAIELPSVEPKPRTGPVLVERVRTAILRLPDVPAAASASGAAAVLWRWVGAFASPLALLLATGLASTGAGPASALALVVGALLAAPAAARSAHWAARGVEDGAMQETALLGAAPGRVAAVVLLLVRLAAVAAVVLALAALESAWAVRTGAFGGSASSTALLGVVVVVVLATAVAALPARATGAVVVVLAAVGAVGTVAVALALAPLGGGPATAAAPSGIAAAAAAGFAGVGLVPLLSGGDVARWRTAVPRPALVAAALAGAVAVGAVLAAAALSIVPADPGPSPEVLVGALSDATAAVLAEPLAVVLLASGLVLPVLLLRSSGAAVARLVDGGRSARLGSLASGLLVLAAALGLVAASTDVDAVLVATAGLAGVPAAVWAGLLASAPAGGTRRGRPAGLVAAAGVLVGWALVDGLLPGFRSPVLAVLGDAAAPVAGGPAAGLAVALIAGLGAGLVARTGGTEVARPSPVGTVGG